MSARRHGRGIRMVFLALAMATATAWVGGIAGAQTDDPAPQPRPLAPHNSKQRPPEGGEVGAQIVGGSPTGTASFPWIGALLDSAQADPFVAQFCGSTLIDPSWVLTSAKCVRPAPAPPLAPADVQVALGFANLDDITPGDRRAIDQIVVNPSYLATTGEFDVALLHLTVPADEIPTAAWQVDEVPDTNPGIFLGWGADPTQGFGTTTLHSGIAKVIGAPSATNCGTWGTAFHSTSQLCIGQSATGGLPATCSGDEGGPFVVGNQGGWVVTGVLNFGPLPCGNANPDVYARVSAGPIKNWITTTIAPPAPVGTYHAVTPLRILDTRFDIGKLATGLVGPRFTINPQITGIDSTGGVPLTGAPTAVVVNITATSPTANGWLTAFPTGASLPNVSNVNFLAGQTVPNLATVQIGQGGKISLNNSGTFAGAGFVHVVMDVVGWYGANATAGFFHNVTPTRIVDTRFGAPANPGLTSKVAAGTPLAPTVCGGTTGVDPSAAAVVINLTAVAGNTAGWATAWPSGAPPLASNLNFVPFEATGHLALVKTNACTIQIGNSPGASGMPADIDIVVDVVGWYGPDAVPAGGYQFHSMVPNRIVDTRFGAPANPGTVGIMSPGATIQVIGRAGGTGVPLSAVSLLTNVTATGPSAYGWLTLHPDNTLPKVSNLNFNGGETIPNLGVVQVGVDDRVRVTNTADPDVPVVYTPFVHVIMDAMGWFE